MARLTPIEQRQAPWHLRWFYRVMRKMFGKELTPAKMQMRLPGLMWGTIAKWKLACPANAGFRCAFLNSPKCGPRRALAARFEWTSILPWAEKRA